MAKGRGRNTETKAALRRDGGFIYLCFLFRPVGFCFSKILRLCRNPPSQNPPVLLPRKSVCCHTLPHRRVRRQPLSRVSRKQRYNTLDFAKQNRVPTGMLRAPIGNPASKGIFPSELPIFSSQTGTQTVKTQFGTPAQKMQKEVRTDEWRTSFLLTI